MPCAGTSPATWRATRSRAWWSSRTSCHARTPARCSNACCASLTGLRDTEENPDMATTVSEKEARQVAEDARERDWRLPSFGKELFLGNFRLDLIHPQPRQDPAAVEKGEAFLERLRTFLLEHVDPLQIERDAKIPDEVVDGLKEMGALGMKVPEQYGGLGLSQVYYNRALMLSGTWCSALSTLLSAHQS